MARLAHAPVAGDIAAGPRSISFGGVSLTSRSPRGRWISCAHSENRSGLARWALLGPEPSIQTSHAYQEDRPLCPACLHLTSIASAVAGHVGPTRLQRSLPGSIEDRDERPDGTGLLATLESSSPWLTLVTRDVKHLPGQTALARPCPRLATTAALVAALVALVALRCRIEPYLDQERRLRRRWPGVSAGLCLGGPPGARRATLQGRSDDSGLNVTYKPREPSALSPGCPSRGQRPRLARMHTW